MASIFGGRSSSPGGGLQGSMQGPGPRDFTAGDQAGGLDLGRMWNAMNWRPPKEYSPSPLETSTSATGISNQMMQEQLKQAQAQSQAMQAETKARSGAMPTKTLFGFNVMPGQTADPSAMNYYQRQAFLPQNTQMGGGGGPSSAGLTPASASAQAAAVNPPAEMSQSDQVLMAMRQYPGMMQRMFPQMYKSGRMMNDDPQPNKGSEGRLY